MNRSLKREAAWLGGLVPARKADVVENLRRNETVSKTVRKKVLALADIYWGSLVQRQPAAGGLIIAKRMSKRQVLQTVRNNQAIIEDVRQGSILSHDQVAYVKRRNETGKPGAVRSFFFRIVSRRPPGLPR